MKLIILIFLMLIATAPDDDGKAIRLRLSAMTKSGSVVNGGKAFGGEYVMPAGTFNWLFSVYISSAQGISGQDAATLVNYYGMPGTSAVTIFSYTGNNYVHRPFVRSFQLNCVNGSMAISKDISAKWIDRLQVEHMVINGGGIELPDENYRCIFNDVEIKINNQQALRVDGQETNLHNVCVSGTIDTAKIVAAVEIHGSVVFSGYNAIEGQFSCPLLSLNDWQGWTGYATADTIWLEQHGKGPTASMTNSQFFAAHVSATVASPWQLNNRSTLDLHIFPEKGSVVGDGTSNVLRVNATTQPIAAKLEN